MKLHRLLRSCVGPSPTTDDAPSPSASQRGSASPARHGPEGLPARARTAETAGTQRPRKKLIAKIQNMPHAFAVRLGFSESRRAVAARAAQAQLRSEGNPVPLEPPVQAAVHQKDQKDGLDHHAEPSAVLSQDSLRGRSPTISSSWHDSRSSSRSNYFEPESVPWNLDTQATSPPHGDTLAAARLEITAEASPQRSKARLPRARSAPLASGAVPSGPVGRQTSQAPQTALRWVSHNAPPVNESPAPGNTPPVTAPPVRTAPQPLGAPPQPAANLASPARPDVAEIVAEVQYQLDETRRSPTLPVPSGPVEPPPPRAPETSLEVIIQTPPLQRPTGRPPRSEAVAATFRQAVQKVHLPQAAQAVADASITRAIGSTASTLIGSPVRGAKQVVSTVVDAADNWWNKPRLSSAGLQNALMGEGVDLNDRFSQGIAHAYAVDYGEAAATVLDAALPLLHQMMKIGVAGTSMAFGLGRTLGMTGADAIGRKMRGTSLPLGLRAGPELPAAAMSSGTAFKFAGTGLLQWGLGSFTGAVGNMAGQYLVAPLVNLIPRQFQAIDHRAVLPDETVELMNRMQDGAGDALRRQVQEAQRDIARIDSPGNVLLGQLAFDTLTGVRSFAQGGLPLGAAGQMSVGLAVSTSAGIAIGAMMATRQSVASQQIPDIEKLRVAEAAHRNQSDDDRAAALAEVDRYPVPLFFPRQLTPAGRQSPGDIETGEPMRNADAAERGRLAGMLETAKRAVQAVASPVGQAWGQSLGSSPLIEPAAPGTNGGITAARAWNTTVNVTASIWNRTVEMAKSTGTTELMSTLGDMAASATEGAARRAILAACNAIGIHTAVNLWFDALAITIPHGDAAIQDLRQEVANRGAGT